MLAYFVLQLYSLHAHNTLYVAHGIVHSEGVYSYQKSAFKCVGAGQSFSCLCKKEV